MATKLSPAMIAMIVEASHFRHHEIIGGNSRTLQAVIDRGLATVKVNTTGGANTVHLTPTGYDTAVTHRPAVEPVEDIVTVAEVVNQADTLAEVAEAARREHFANATSEDINRAFCESPTYKASHAALMAAIVAAYPDTDAEAVYDVWVDCNESIAYCANYVREQAIADAAEAARMAAEDLADAAADTARDAATLNLSSDYRRFLTGREDNRRYALALAHAHATLDVVAVDPNGAELGEFSYTLPTEVYGMPVTRTVRAVFNDVNVYDDGTLLCGVARYVTASGAQRAVAVLAARVAQVDADDMADAREHAAEHAQDAWVPNTEPVGAFPPGSLLLNPHPLTETESAQLWGYTSDRTIVLDQPGYTEWTRTIRGVDYAFTMTTMGDDGTATIKAYRERYVDGDTLADSVRLHRIVWRPRGARLTVGPRTIDVDRRDPNGAIIGWERTIGGGRYRFVLGTNTTNGAVAAMVNRLDADTPYRVIPFRKAAPVITDAQVSDVAAWMGTQPAGTLLAPKVDPSTLIHVGTWRESCASHGCPGCVAPRATQPPVVTLPPRTVATGKRSVPRKGRGRRSSGWRKAGKG